MSFQIASAYLAQHVLFLAATTTTAAKKTTSSSVAFIYILLIIAVGAYLWMRPQRKRLRQQQSAQSSFDVGDEVVTTGGVIGRVRNIAGDRVELEIAPGTTIEVLRQAIARRAEARADDLDSEPPDATSYGSPAGNRKGDVGQQREIEPPAGPESSPGGSS